MHAGGNAYDAISKIGQMANALDNCLLVSKYEIGDEISPPVAFELEKPSARGQGSAIEVTPIESGDRDAITNWTLTATYEGYFTE